MVSREGGKPAAAPIESRRQNGIEFFEYLRGILQGVPTHPPDRILHRAPFYWRREPEPADTS